MAVELATVLLSTPAVQRVASSVASAMMKWFNDNKPPEKVPSFSLDTGPKVGEHPSPTETTKVQATATPAVDDEASKPDVTIVTAQNTVSAREDLLTSAQALEMTNFALLAGYSTATAIRSERMRQARLSFNAAISLAVLGVLIIFCGIALLLARESITGGALTAAIGAVTEVMSVILFKFNNETNNRLDAVGKDLRAFESAQTAMIIIQKIEDVAKRDEAMREVANSLRSLGK